eukprot:658981-Amphidinium_carterae.1
MGTPKTGHEVTYVMLCGKPPFWGSLRQQLTRSLAERFPMSRPPWDVISNEAKESQPTVVQN